MTEPTSIVPLRERDFAEFIANARNPHKIPDKPGAISLDKAVCVSGAKL
jgi:hypothetical protein